jgi:membrane fusion protein (multidrug efflux system)
MKRWPDGRRAEFFVMRRFVLMSLLSGLALAGAACGESNTSATASAAPATPDVQLAPENTATAAVATISAGPAVSGQLTPAREATIRAQVGGSLVALPFDRGQAVKSGTVLATIASRDLDATMASAQTAIKSAESGLQMARSELQRTEILVKGGAVAARDLEQAQNAVSNAEAQVSAARARQKSVWQQLDDTTVRAPFAGIVSDRPANAGDVVSPGTALLTIIDPSSLRLEANVPSDQIQQVKPGSKVTFKIRGMPDRTFEGRVDRINPTADPVTRQVMVFVTLPNTGRQLIAGLFAEGRVETSVREGIVVPLGAVDETGAVPTATRIRDGKADRVAVQLGLRQPDTETVEITSGLAAGDVLIVGSAKGLAAGTPVKVTKQ